MRKLVNITLLILLPCVSYAQQPPQKDINLEQFIEEIFAVQDGSISSDELFETLLLFYANPIDLNNTTEEELQSLFILSQKQIANLIDYTKQRGPILSLYELQTIPLFNSITINKLLPFVTVTEKGLIGDSQKLLDRIFSEENNFLLLRYERTLEDRRGYLQSSDSIPAPYSGDPGKFYTRFRVSHRNDFSIGFTAEKDAGEKFIWDESSKRYGADFYSGHFQLFNQGKFKNIVIGDYQMQYGQSLVLGAGFNVGKGAETITTVRRSNLGIRPYTSAIETNFFRGAAATYQVTENIEVTGFVSRLRQDGSLLIDSGSFISSVIQSGFHRTENEISRKGNITEQNIGATLVYKDPERRFSIGSTYLNTLLNKPIQRADRLYNNFEFAGDNNQTASLFGDWNWQNFNAFGEVATSSSGGIGATAGIIGALSPRLETSFVFRHYERDFHSFYGNAFGESTRNINETGLYWGLKYSPTRKWTVATYFDSFKFPWLRSRVNAPSAGYEYLARVTYRPTRSILLYAQIREEGKPQNPSSGSQEAAVRFPVDGVKRNYLFNIDYPANEQISFKTRVQWSSYDFNDQFTEGYALWQDINVNFGQFRFSGRFALFDTDDFNNAQYAFERDVLYAFSVPAYNGVGTRQYIVLQYRPIKKLTLWLKYARTNFRDRAVISSGNETIFGNIETDIRAQARITF